MEAKLVQLQSILSPEEYDQIKNLPEGLIDPILNSKKEEIEEKKVKENLEELKAKVWGEHLTNLGTQSDDLTLEQMGHITPDLAEGIFSKKFMTASKDAKSGEVLVVKFRKRMFPLVLQLLADKKAELEEEFMEKNKPKSKKKGSGKRSARMKDDELDINYPSAGADGSKENAQGKDYAFWFPGDKELITYKDGDKKQKEDGTWEKKRRWRKVRKESPFIAEYQPETCKGAINWDRASGSEYLKEEGVKGSFKMKCSKNKDIVDGYCSKCAKNKTNFYAGKYKMGVGWAKFICDADEKEGGSCLDGIDVKFVEDKVKEAGGTW